MTLLNDLVQLVEKHPQLGETVVTRYDVYAVCKLLADYPNELAEIVSNWKDS